MYVLDGRKLGGQAPGDIQIPQVVQVVDATIRPTISHHMHNSIPVWKSSEGVNAYVWGESDFLRRYHFDFATQKFVVPVAATASILAPSGMPGGMMTLSANQSHSGILWATLPRLGDANQMTVPGELYAFDADNLRLLWSSQNPGDDPLNFAKGSPPIVANGRVYVASISNFVSVYGARKRAAKSQNLALNASATGSAPCAPSQTPDKAFNGSAEAGIADKWCSSAPNSFLQVDLGQPLSIGRVVVEHAGAGGEDFNLNTRDFNVQVSMDGANFSTVASTSDNIQSITTHDIPSTTARYVRLNVLKPGEGTAPASIYELQVFAPPPFSILTHDIDPVATASTSSFRGEKPTPQASTVLAAQEETGKKAVQVTSTGRVITPPPDVAAPPRDAEVTASGLAMKVLRSGSGTERPVANDCVTVRFVAWTTDGALFSTSTTMNDSDVICLNAAILGISEALEGMVVDEKRRLWIPEDLTFHEHHHAQRRPEDEQPPRKDLTFDLELLSIQKAPPTPADLSQPPATAVRTSSGLAYEVLKDGTGTKHPSQTSTVSVHFSGWRDDGRLFESTVMANHPASVSIATAPKGWREALCSMAVGEKARFWIPATLAFGEKPANRFNPSGALIYEFELLSIQ
jgi:peptidylprolyl isomerase